MRLSQLDLTTLYNKIGKAEFFYPFWFPFDAKSFLYGILDPNPPTENFMRNTVIPKVAKHSCAPKVFRVLAFKLMKSRMTSGLIGVKFLSGLLNVRMYMLLLMLRRISRLNLNSAETNHAPYNSRDGGLTIISQGLNLSAMLDRGYVFTVNSARNMILFLSFPFVFMGQ
ncbi:hypothetical protein C5167_008201 [Papaver somniferum]|uniref:Uncharacterized protein n=1 Tax=Papaver somniferum TaxID=3469 RepID=A0A4Y7JUY8_PAPSO|nr:hypothetical protein C5167_008201 [Papaver somniferum]